MSPRLTKTRFGSNSSTIASAASIVNASGACPETGTIGCGLPAVGGAGAEDAVEVLLAQHRAGGEARARLSRSMTVRDAGCPSAGPGRGLAARAVVDRVGGHAGPVGAHAGHHHHVVGDGLHDRQRRARAGSPVPPSRSAARFGVSRRRSRRACSRRRPGRRPACVAAAARAGAPARRETRRRHRPRRPPEDGAGGSRHAGRQDPPVRRRGGPAGAGAGGVGRRPGDRGRLRSARSPMTNQSICARCAVMSRTEKPWSSKLRYLMCRLFALIASSTAMLVVPRRRAGDVLEVVRR